MLIILYNFWNDIFYQIILILNNRLILNPFALHVMCKNHTFQSTKSWFVKSKHQLFGRINFLFCNAHSRKQALIINIYATKACNKTVPEWSKSPGTNIPTSPCLCFSQFSLNWFFGQIQFRELYKLRHWLFLSAFLWFYLPDFNNSSEKNKICNYNTLVFFHKERY